MPKAGPRRNSRVGTILSGVFWPSCYHPDRIRGVRVIATSRTQLCFATAALLAGLATATACLRFHVLGDDLHLAAAADGFRVTLLVRGHSTGRAAIVTVRPLIMGRQYVQDESCVSEDFAFTADDSSGQPAIRWRQQAPAAGPVRASYDFHCNVSIRRPTPEMERNAREVYRAPAGAAFLAAPDMEVRQLASELTYGIGEAHDKALALFQYVDQSLADHDALPRAQRLVNLCRSAGIPARLVHGLALGQRGPQKPHAWVEAFTGDAWVSLCPTYHYCGQMPVSFLILSHGDALPVQTTNLRDVEFAYLVAISETEQQASESPWRWFFAALSLHRLPLADWQMTDFLLLMPLAALIVCLCRNVIGLPSFGIFAPALIGMAFRQTSGITGVAVFSILVVAGWGIRRSLDGYHLLQAPRTAVLLTMLAVTLIAVIVAAHHLGLTVARHISLIPMVILAGMAERFWTMEAEDSMAASLKTLLATMFIAALVGALTSIPAVVACFTDYPETLGLVVAGQLLIGRYTGYRLSELLRFRDLVDQPLSRL